MIGYETDKQFEEGWLPVSRIHKLYYSQAGNPSGLPVVFFHGGPGYHSNPDHRRFFNPDRYRIILFDQRGCGQSIPLGEIAENTTQDLIADAEALRIHLGIRQWVVAGSSWGSTLALVYASQHPTAVKHLLLRGIFLARSEDIRWLEEEHHVRPIYPELFEARERLLLSLGVNPHAPLLYQRLFSLFEQSSSTTKALICQVASWENHFMSAVGDPLSEIMIEPSSEDISHCRVYLHYLSHHCFLGEHQILDLKDVLNDIPTDIIHGRLDLVCPYIQAWELHKALPQSNLHSIAGAGHDSHDPGMTEKMIEIADKIATFFRQRRVAHREQ